MATVRTLKLRMGTLSGVKTWSFKYISQNVTAAKVKALGQALITNGSVYKYPPQVLQSATLEESQETSIDVS